MLVEKIVCTYLQTLFNYKLFSTYRYYSEYPPAACEPSLTHLIIHDSSTLVLPQCT